MNTYEKCNITLPRNFINPDQISYYLQCCICNEVYNNPMRLDCGHTYCYNCIKGWMKKKNECPNCRTSIVESLISRDLLAYNIINDLEVSCNNEDKGCPWKGPLLELENHVKTCNAAMVILRETKMRTEEKNETKTPIKTLAQMLKRKGPIREEETNRENKNIVDLLIRYNKEKINVVPVLKSEEKRRIKEMFTINKGMNNENNVN